MALRNAKPKDGASSRRLMDNQDTDVRGDSRATRTRLVTISTTDAIADAVDEAAHRHWMNRSRYVEWCIVQQLEREEKEVH